jgi:hypothetical protein
MPVPDFSPGEVLTAAAMDSIGLWLVKTQTIGTGVSSVTITNAFSNIYDDYLITVSGGTASANSVLSMRFGTVVSGYRWNYMYGSFNNTGATAGTLNNPTILYVGTVATNGITAAITVNSPFLTKPTAIHASGGSPGSFSGVVQGYEPNATSFTSFDLLPSTGTFSAGTIRVYGYRN